MHQNSSPSSRCSLPPFERCCLWLLVLMLGALPAPEAPRTIDPGSATVAVINGQPLSLKDVEDAMLRKEGIEQAQKLLAEIIKATDWTTLKDDEVVLMVAGRSITKRDVVLSLIRQGVGKVREDLISIRAVQQVLAAEGIVVGQEQVQATWSRMERQFWKSQELRGNDRIDFASWIRTKEGMEPDQYMREEAFRMLAGVQELVIRKVARETKEADLRHWHDLYRQRFDEAEGVHLSVIHVPFDNKIQPIPEDEKLKRFRVMRLLHKNIQGSNPPFAVAWQGFGRSYDSYAKAGGDIGWVGRDGKRDPPQARPVPPGVLEKAFPLEQGFPVLLEPILAADGIDLVLVHGHRPFKSIPFEAARKKVIEDMIADQMEARTAAILREIIPQADVQRLSLPEIIRARAGQEQPAQP